MTLCNDGRGTTLCKTTGIDNIVVASPSEWTRPPITSAPWNLRGLPVMLATCAVASILYAIAYPLF